MKLVYIFYFWQILFGPCGKKIEKYNIIILDQQFAHQYATRIYKTCNT